MNEIALDRLRIQLGSKQSFFDHLRHLCDGKFVDLAAIHGDGLTLISPHSDLIHQGQWLGGHPQGQQTAAPPIGAQLHPQDPIGPIWICGL